MGKYIAFTEAVNMLLEYQFIKLLTLVLLSIIAWRLPEIIRAWRGRDGG